MVPYNPYDLPDSEMDRGQKHVINTIDAVSTVGHIVRKIYHGLFITFGRAHQNPCSHATVSSMSINENILDIIAGGRHKQERGPKVENATKESITGSPKGSNSYGDGAPVVVHRKGSHSMYKEGQRFYSTSPAAAEDKYFDGEELLLKMRVRDGKYTGLYKLLTEDKLLFAAY